MAEGLNRVTLLGNLGADPDLKMKKLKIKNGEKL